MEQLIERLPEGQWNYSLTITFSKPLEKLKPWMQFRDTIGTIARKIAECSDDFEIHPELTLKGRLHYHIRLQLKDKIKFYKSLIPFLNKCGYFDLSKTKSYEQWQQYCEKESFVMKHVLEYPFLPVTKEIYKNKIKNKKINTFYRNQSNEAFLKFKELNTLTKQFQKSLDDEEEYERALMELDPFTDIII